MQSLKIKKNKKHYKFLTLHKLKSFDLWQKYINQISYTPGNLYIFLT